MTARVLNLSDPSDFGLLAGTDIEELMPMLPGTRVIVVEEGDTVVGHLMLAPMWHAEGFYVAQGYRGKGVDTLLVAKMHDEARAMGVGTVFPAAATDGMVNYVTRLGAVEIPARWFALAVKES